MTNDTALSFLSFFGKKHESRFVCLKSVLWVGCVVAITLQSLCMSLNINMQTPETTAARVATATTTTTTTTTKKIPILDASTLPQPVEVIQWNCYSKEEQSGTFKQLRFAFESLEYAIVHGMYWQIEPLGASVTEGCDVPFGNIIDFEALQQAFPETIITNTHNVPLKRTEVPCVKQLLCSKGPHPLHLQTWGRIMEHVRPAPAILQIANQIRETLLPRQFVCLHPRVEPDYQKMFQHDSMQHARYKTPAQIQIMMKTFKFGTADGDGDGDPIDTLYLAGGASLLDLSFGFKHNVDKSSLVKTLSSMNDMLHGSLIDIEVCKHSMYHVGTAGSIWDEWISEWRHLHNLPSLMYAGDHMPKTTLGLVKFVGANDKAHLVQ
jgi:hypothetical protein